jgi:poly(glycerol-phosphate) alpha-glucosyltransferase
MLERRGKPRREWSFPRSPCLEFPGVSLPSRFVSLEVAFFSVLPSPYQRDLFRALSRRAELRLRVFYLEADAPDSPWPERALENYETILPGGRLCLGGARWPWNWPLPDISGSAFVVLNSLMSFTAQWLMRFGLRRKPWIFWGERLRRGGRIHSLLYAPLRRATAIASVGTFAEMDYRQRFPEARHFSIPYHCALDAFLAEPRPARSDGDIVFLFCGQMIARKGLDILLNAFRELESNARLLLVGREAELSVLLAPLPVAVRDRITYAGFQPPEELPRFFAKADVFVLPSRYDGWGVVVNQALGAGLPILCSDQVGAGRDLVREGVNGLRFRAGDVLALKEVMARCLEEPQRLTEWSAASRKQALEWTPEAGAARWIAAWRELGLL